MHFQMSKVKSYGRMVTLAIVVYATIILFSPENEQLHGNVQSEDIMFVKGKDTLDLVRVTSKQTESNKTIVKEMTSHQSVPAKDISPNGGFKSDQNMHLYSNMSSEDGATENEASMEDSSNVSEISDNDQDIEEVITDVRVPQDEFSSVMPWLNRSDGVHETYLLSAFWDDRWLEVSDPFISALVFMKRAAKLPDSVQMYCVITCGDDDSLNPQVILANMTDIKRRTDYRPREIDGVYYLRIVIPCRPTDCRRPERITVTYDNRSITTLDDTNSVQVEYPLTDMKHEFGICVPPIFGCLNPYYVIEWMEMHKILGVSKVVIHNYSQCEETSKIFEEYGRQGLVELRQDRTVTIINDSRTVGGWKDPMWRHELFVRDPLMLTDCMYRHMYDTKHFFFVDMDEILIPVKAESLHDMVEQVKDAYSLNETGYSQMTFSNFFFLMDDIVTTEPADTSLPDFTSYLQHRKRLGPSPTNGRMKSLVRPTRCEYVHNHICPSPIVNLKPEAPSHEHVFVDAAIAKVHHYRSSPCRERRPGIMTCQGEVSSKPVINDDSLLRFADKLVANVRKQLEIVGLSTTLNKEIS